MLLVGYAAAAAGFGPLLVATLATVAFLSGSRLSQDSFCARRDLQLKPCAEL